MLKNVFKMKKWLLIGLIGLLFTSCGNRKEQKIKEQQIKDSIEIVKQEKRIQDSLNTIEQARIEDSLILVKQENKNIRIDSLKNSLIIEKDEYSLITWYKPKNTPNYINSRNYAGLYLGDNDNLRLYVNYFGKNWIFFERVYFIIDGETWDIGIASYDREGDVHYNGVTEIGDWYISDKLKFIEMCANAKNPIKIKLEGRYSKEYTFSVNNFKPVAQLYLLLNEE